MTKSKTSTIAIVVLSVLLAAALASTIVLAAFSASRQATTTIQFAGGITLEVTGISGTGSDNWEVTDGTSAYTLADGSVTVAGDKNVILSEIKASVSGNTAYIAVLPVVSYTKESAPEVDVTVSAASGLTDLDTTSYAGWKYTSTAVAAGADTQLVPEFKLFDKDASDAADYASRKYTCSVYIVAATGVDGLKEAIDALNL